MTSTRQQRYPSINTETIKIMAATSISKRIIKLCQLSLLALISCLATACSSGSSSVSSQSIVNGYYLSSDTLFVTHDDPRFQDSTFTINYSLSERENLLTSTDVIDGDSDRDRVTSFDNNGMLLMQIYAGPSNNLLSDDPYDVRFSNTYNENGLLTRTDLETKFLLYEYQNNLVVKRKLYSIGFDKFQSESRFIYNNDNQLESVTSYAMHQPGTDLEPNWVALDRCLYFHDNGLMNSNQCERFSSIANAWTTTSNGTYEYDEAGNLIVIVDTIIGGDGSTQTLTSSYEYEQTARDVPNLQLFYQRYFLRP